MNKHVRAMFDELQRLTGRRCVRPNPMLAAHTEYLDRKRPGKYHYQWYGDSLRSHHVLVTPLVGRKVMRLYVASYIAAEQGQVLLDEHRRLWITCTAEELPLLAEWIVGYTELCYCRRMKMPEMPVPLRPSIAIDAMPVPVDVTTDEAQRTLLECIMSRKCDTEETI